MQSGLPFVMVGLALTFPPVPHSYLKPESKRGAEKLIQRRAKALPAPATITIGWDWIGTNAGVTFNVWECRTNQVVAPNTNTWVIVINVPTPTATFSIDKAETRMVLWSVTATNRYGESGFCTSH
jgi:hypothetical protein